MSLPIVAIDAQRLHECLAASGVVLEDEASHRDDAQSYG